MFYGDVKAWRKLETAESLICSDLRSSYWVITLSRLKSSLSTVIKIVTITWYQVKNILLREDLEKTFKLYNY